MSERHPSAILIILCKQFRVELYCFTHKQGFEHPDSSNLFEFMVKMNVYNQTSLTVIPLGLKGQAGEV